MRRLQRFGWAALVVLAGAGIPQLARGDGDQPSIQDRVTALEKDAKDTQKTITEKLGVAIHGLVAVDYLYDINRPSGGAQPALRVFENKKNSFLLNQGNIHVERQPESGLGFVVDLDFGETANVVNNATFFGRTDKGGNNITGNGTDFFDARQFYLTYTVPVGSGIKLKAGRFVTLAGAEVIKSYNNLNYNVTESILFGFSIPFTHTGIMASYAFNDLLSLDLCVINGWDTVADNNDGKSVHSGLTIAPSPRFTIYITGTYGPEQTAHSVMDNLGNTLTIHPGKSERLLLTTLITVKPTDQLTLILDHNYGRETDVVPRDGGLHTAEWHGLAGYVVYAFTDALSGTLRAEVFNDMDGARVLGFPNGGSGLAATYFEVSPAVTYKIADGLLWRNELRHDESDTKKAFPRENRFARGQDTIATELVYTF
jgi:hypothetical protein